MNAMPLMKCGCVATGIDLATGKHVCVSCIGIVPGADEVADEVPSLEGRIARCSCKKECPSSYDLPFFEYRGPGSRSSRDYCRTCAYMACAHAAPLPRHLSSNVCDHFEPHGPYDCDLYYCGCRGWD